MFFTFVTAVVSASFTAQIVYLWFDHRDRVAVHRYIDKLNSYDARSAA